MRIRKILLLVSCLLLVSAQVWAAPGRKKRSAHQVGTIKFGPHGGIGRELSAGVFGEYALNNNLGVQVSMGYGIQQYGVAASDSVQKAIYDASKLGYSVEYIHSPIVLRVYQGEDRQFCWQIGARVGYLTNAHFVINQTPLQDILEKGEITSRFQVGIIGGVDYEFKMGLMLGLMMSQDLINIAEQISLDFNSKLSLGYNFGRFLE